jgi:MFS family permease
MNKLSSNRELNYLKLTFFLFGFLIMSWLPRFPEVKANLGLSNGEFGSIISTSAVGALVALFTAGQLVHNFGAKRVMYIAAASMAISLVLLTNTSSTLVFLTCNIVQAAAISAFHVSINTQGFSFQDRNKRHVVTLLSGFWSSGALATAVVSGLLVDHISLSMHILVLSIVVLITMLITITKLSESLVKPNQNSETAYTITDLLKGFKIDGIVSGGLFCAIFLEFSVGDWAAIFVKEDIGIKGGAHTLPYILFTFAMIAGRLTVHHLYSKFSMEFLVKTGSLISGISFLIGILATRFIGVENKTASLIILSVSFTLAGLGSSYLGPSIMNAANIRSKSPSSVVIGQIGVVNNIASMLMRLVIAWTAQAFSLSVALIIPALLILTVPYFAKMFRSA